MTALSHLRPYLIPAYFTLGGLAGGLLFLGGLAALMSLPALEAAPRARDLFALPLLLASALILTADLTHPLRFWRLLVTFRAGSAVSWGSWILTGAGVLAAVAAAPLWADVPVASPVFRVAAELRDAMGPRVVDALAMVFGAGLAGYTGVLLTASSRLRWHATPLLGGAYLLTACASAAAVTNAVAGTARLGQRVAFLAVLLGAAAWMLRAHLEALSGEVRAGRLERAVPEKARGWLVGAALAMGAAVLMSPLVIGGMGRPANVALAAAVLAGDLCVRFATFWFEEGP